MHQREVWVKMRCSSLGPPLRNTSPASAHLGSPNPLRTSITCMYWTARQTDDTTDVAKMIGLNCAKGNNTTLYFHIYIGEKKTHLPSASWSVLSLIFKLLFLCNGKVYIWRESPVSVRKALCSSAGRTCPLCRYSTLRNICSQEQKDPVERHLFNWHIFNYSWWIKLTFRNTRLGWH